MNWGLQQREITIERFLWSCDNLLCFLCRSFKYVQRTFKDILFKIDNQISQVTFFHAENLYS